MITLTSAQLHTWIATFLWPLTRILGLIAVAPLFGNISVPFQVKVGLSIMLTLIIAPIVPTPSALDPISLAGLLILAQQLVIGLAMGFVMRLVFAGVEMAGETAGLTMGLGFATFFDPQSQGRSSAISQFLALLALMLFLAMNVHLLLISVLAESFSSLPILSTTLSAQSFLQIAQWGGRLFSFGLQLSLPIIAALLITNLALGILTRAAPQLNLFGIGFPITISAGFIVIALALPYFSTPLEQLFQEGINTVGKITTVTVPATKK